MSTTFVTLRISSLLETLAPSPRPDILLALENGERCVCHLEAALGLRQAYLSQHLMALRKAGLISSRKQGRFVYYRLCEPEVIPILRRLAEMAGVPAANLHWMSSPAPDCPCPDCRKMEKTAGRDRAEKA